MMPLRSDVSHFVIMCFYLKVRLLSKKDSTRTKKVFLHEVFALICIFSSFILNFRFGISLFKMPKFCKLLNTSARRFKRITINQHFSTLVVTTLFCNGFIVCKFVVWAMMHPICFCNLL